MIHNSMDSTHLVFYSRLQEKVGIFVVYARRLSTFSPFHERMNFMQVIESNLFVDPQRLPSLPCPVCRREVYPPGYVCIRCRRDGL